MNIRYKAIGFSLLFTLIPLAFLGTAAFVQTGSILRQKLLASTETTLNQVAARIEYVTEDIQDLSLFLLQESELRGLLSDDSVDQSLVNTPMARVENSLRALAHSKEYIHSIYIARPDGVAINPQNTPDQITDSVMELALRRPGAPAWFTDTVRDYAFNQTRVLSMARIIRDVADITTHLGAVRINVSVPELTSMLSDALESEKDVFVLMEGGEVIASVGQDDGARSSSRAEVPLMQGETDVLASVVLPNTVLTLVYRRAMDAGVAESRRVLIIMVGVMMASLSVYAVVASVFLRRLITPIRDLRESMSRLEQGDFSIRLPEGREDEIGLLVGSFNTMAARLNELVHRVYASELHLRDAELRALQTQINPHFLYNTLDVLYWASRLESAPQTGSMIQALSQLFRYSLGSGEATTTVEDEVTHLENYLTIQRCVYEENVRFSLEVDPEVRSLQTVRLVLQPLVENAIHHGIEPAGGQGHVSIRAVRVGQALEFSVVDTGPGFWETRLEKVIQKEEDGSRSIGLRNVHERVRLVFGEEYGIRLENSEHGGARVVVRQPVTENAGATS